MTVFHHRLIKNLKHYRKRQGMSQQKLAEECVLSTNYISEIEAGRKFPSAATMEKIIKVLNIEPESLFLENHGLVNPENSKKAIFPHANELSQALLGYINESLGSYAGKSLDKMNAENEE